MIRKKAMGNLNGMIEGNIMGFGKKGNKMGKGNFLTLRLMNGKKVCGKKGKELNGLKIRLLYFFQKFLYTI